MRDLLENLTQLALSVLGRLSPEDRVTFMSDIKNEFCEHCGRLHPNTGRCQCNNDE